MTLFKETAPGAFEEKIYLNSEIKQDENNFYLEIPNHFLFEEDMKLWSAYENEIFINDIKLKRKKTGKIDIKDPYLYILLTK